MVDLFRGTTPKARKDHKCNLCGQIIEQGQRYVRNEYLMDGDFRSDAYHAKCAEAIAIYCEYFGDNEFVPDVVMEYSEARGIEVGP